DGVETVEAQQSSQPLNVNLVTWIAFSHRPVFSWIANHQFRHARFEQVVQPGRPGSFFKRDAHVSAQPVDKNCRIMLALVSMTPVTPPWAFTTAPRDTCSAFSGPYIYIAR